MKKVIVGLLVFIGLARGQATVTLSDTLTRPDGTRFAGSLTIVLKYAGPLSTSSYTLTAGLKRVQVANGTLSITLTPNSSITPAGTSYAVRYAPSDGSPGWDEIWIVPSSPTTTTVRAVRGSTAPSPTVMFPPQQLSTAGASPGQAIIYNGSGITWGSVAAGSVAWGSVTGVPSLQADLAPYVRTLLSAASPIVYNSISGLISCPTCGAGGGGGTWGSITGTLSSQTDLQLALNAKAALSHTHIIADITSLQGALDAKASATHQHNGGDITSGYIGPAYLGSGTRTGAKFLRDDGTWQNASGGVATVFGRSGDVVAEGTDYATFYAALSHVHLIADVTGLQTALDGKAAAAHNHSGVYEPVDATIIRSSGSYINPAWIASIAWAKITDPPPTYAPSAHDHATSDIQAGSKTGSGSKIATATGSPADGCASWTSGDIGSTGSPCGAGGTTSSVASAKQEFSAQTTVTVTHNFGSKDQVGFCRDGSDVAILPNSITFGTSLTVFTFTGEQTGTCFVVGGTGLPGTDFTGQTSVTLSHNLGTKDIGVACRNTSDVAIEPNTVTATSTSAATVTFTSAQDGRCVVIGTLAIAGGGGGGTGTVTSVALSAPTEFSVSGAPVTGAGTLGLTWASQAQALVFASPASTTGTPSFRSLVDTDLPTIDLSKVSSAAKTGTGGRAVTATSVPLNGCATFSDGNLASTGTACGSGGGGGTITTGTGLLGVGSVADPARIDPATVPTFLTGSSALSDWNSGADNVPAASCQEKSFTLSGASTGDSIAPGWPATLPNGLAPSMLVGGANTIVVRLCNSTAGAISVSDGLAYRATILKTF